MSISWVKYPNIWAGSDEAGRIRYTAHLLKVGVLLHEHLPNGTTLNHGRYPTVLKVKEACSEQERQA